MSRRLPLAFALIALVLLSCVGCEPSSATDREKGQRELQEMLARNAESREHLRFVAERTAYADAVDRAFAARFEGRIVPGAGCDVCREMCRMADLRPISADELLPLYRAAAAEHGYPSDDPTYQLAALELTRLVCIVRGGDRELRRAWLRLLDASEDHATRYFAAVQAIQHDLADDGEPRRVLVELSRGPSKFASPAANVLEEWALGIEPSL